MRILGKSSILAVLLAILPVTLVLSQNSPFAGYGMGEIHNGGFGRNYSMGGTGIGVRSNLYLNNLNPAAYSAIDTLSFFFEAGMKGKFQTLSIEGEKPASSHNIDVDYLSFGFPITKFMCFSVGIRPATSADYDFRGINEAVPSKDGIVTEETQTYDIRYVGQGNISNLYGGLGIQLTNALSIGAHVNYLFGDIKNFYVQSFTMGGSMYGVTTERRISDVIVDLGMQYSFLVNNVKNNRLTFGAVFNPRMDFRGNSSYIFGAGNNLEMDGSVAFSDTFKISSKDNFAQMPMGFGAGVSYIINNRLVIAADFSTKLWSKTNLTATEMYNQQNVTITDAKYYSLGLEWTPNQHTGIKYYERIRYRLGFRYADDYIKIDDAQVTDFGITAGFGFPLRRTSTSINFTVDIGKKGIADKSVTEERYGKVTLSFTLHEFWFIKSKIR